MAPETSGNAQRPRHIIVAGDTALNIFGDDLEYLGFTVLLAESFEQVLLLLQDPEVALLVTDNRMKQRGRPELTPAEIVRRDCEAGGRNLKILVIHSPSPPPPGIADRYIPEFDVGAAIAAIKDLLAAS